MHAQLRFVRQRNYIKLTTGKLDYRRAELTSSACQKKGFTSSKLVHDGAIDVSHRQLFDAAKV